MRSRAGRKCGQSNRALGDRFCRDHLPPRRDDQRLEVTEQTARIPVGRDRTRSAASSERDSTRWCSTNSTPARARPLGERAASYAPAARPRRAGLKIACRKAFGPEAEGAARATPLRKPSSRSASYSARSSSRSSSSAARRRLPTRRSASPTYSASRSSARLRWPPVVARRRCPEPLARALVRHRSAASAKPPFRPLAPSATPRASWTRTRSPASASVSAAEQPVIPAPTMSTSGGPSSGLPYELRCLALPASMRLTRRDATRGLTARYRPSPSDQPGELEGGERRRDVGGRSSLVARTSRRRSAGASREHASTRRVRVELRLATGLTASRPKQSSTSAPR